MSTKNTKTEFKPSKYDDTLLKLLKALTDPTGIPKLSVIFETLGMTDDESAGRAHSALIYAHMQGWTSRTRAYTESDGFKWWALEPTENGRKWMAWAETQHESAGT